MLPKTKCLHVCCFDALKHSWNTANPRNNMDSKVTARLKTIYCLQTWWSTTHCWQTPRCGLRAWIYQRQLIVRIEAIVGGLQTTWRLYLLDVFDPIQNVVPCALYAYNCFAPWCNCLPAVGAPKVSGRWGATLDLRSANDRSIGSCLDPRRQLVVCLMPWGTPLSKWVWQWPSTLNALARLVLQILERIRCTISLCNIRNRTPHMYRRQLEHFNPIKWYGSTGEFFRCSGYAGVVCSRSPETCMCAS